MNVHEFLSELIFYYPLNRKDEDIPKLLDAYSDDICAVVYKNKGCRCDYHKLLRLVRANYAYRTFPPCAEILKHIPEALYMPESFSGREGQTIKRVIFGREYEFTIVPNHWGVKTISQLDEEIKQKHQTEHKNNFNNLPKEWIELKKQLIQIKSL